MSSGNGQFDTSLGKFLIDIGKFIPSSPKLWARVTWHNGNNRNWLPSIADLHRLAFYLAACEDVKYPEARQEGGTMLYRYMMAAYSDAKRWRRKFAVEDIAGIEAACRDSYDRLEKEFKTPTRNEYGEVLRTNGAFQRRAEAIADAMPKPKLFE